MFRIAKIWTAAVALLSQASARASISSVPALSAKRCTNPSARRSAYLANWTCSFGTVLVPSSPTGQIGSRLSQPLRVLSTQTGLVAFRSRGKPLSMSR